jgi:hypothetical protein
MANTQQINQCVQTCTQAANSLRGAANALPDPGVRDMLTQGAHHIELCIRQCQSATQIK